MEGLVFNIQRFSLHDGPGVRTVLFLKGCPLQCTWCSNPESQRFEAELLYSERKCLGCKQCEEQCTQRAISVGVRGVAIDKRKCLRCGGCAEACPSGALRLIGERMQLSEVLRRLERDLPFFQKSGGGVTLSGGEPLGQGDFCRELIAALHEDQIHVSVETSGCASWDCLWRTLEKADLILYDLKEYNSHRHEKMTGVPNETILENARKIAREKEVVFRIPVVPGFNTESFRELACFIRDCNNAAEVHLLPYHAYGAAKYLAIGRQYGCAEVNPPSRRALTDCADTFHKEGLTVRIH